MKKHIIGGALFALIVSSFAFVYALLGYRSAEVPEVVVAPAQDVSVRVASSFYDLDSGRISTTIRLDWKGRGNPPDRVFVRREIYIAEAVDNVRDAVYQEIREPFRDSRSAQVSLENFLPDLNLTDSNLYVRVTAGVDRGLTGDSPQVSPVLFVHGERSKVRY